MTWHEISIELHPAHVERVAAIVLRYAPQGFIEESSARGRRRVLRCYLAGGAAGRRAGRRLRRDLVWVATDVRVRSRTVRDDEWRDAWKAYARPTRIGRVVVVPSHWRRRGGSGGVVVRLDPGMAFGSGEHPTTQLCLRAIERLLGAGDTVIDIGTGSGILAIAAAKLGAARVLAIDNDPVAVRVARANVRLNGVERRVTVRLADGLQQARLGADLIVANLTARALPAVLSRAVRCLRPGGHLVGSGFGVHAVGDVVRAFSAAGLCITGVSAQRGWRAVEAVAPGPRTRARATRRRVA